MNKKNGTPLMDEWRLAVVLHLRCVPPTLGVPVKPEDIPSPRDDSVPNSYRSACRLCAFKTLRDSLRRLPV